MSALNTIPNLALLLRTTIDPSDGYAELILEQASNSVRDYMRQPGWVTADPPGDGQTVAPQVARDVTLWVAARAYTNPKNLERRTAGPISETFRDVGVLGVELTESEKERLGTPAGRSSNGLWVLQTSTPGGVSKVYLPDRPGATYLLMAEGEDVTAFVDPAEA